jgi:cytochrome c oxidase cbb3-type subunit 3
MSDQSKKKEDELLNSNYGGIQEYDNDLPKWWIYLFYLTIVFGFIYAFYIHIANTPTDSETLTAEMEQIRALQQPSSSSVALNESDYIALLKEDSRIATGKEIYAAKCLACHGANGEGLVGPNLTDEYWIHGGKALEIKHTIENGVLEKGMLAWKTILQPEEINSVVSYLWSIRNTNLPGKAAEGEKS